MPFYFVKPPSATWSISHEMSLSLTSCQLLDRSRAVRTCFTVFQGCLFVSNSHTGTWNYTQVVLWYGLGLP